MPTVSIITPFYNPTDNQIYLSENSIASQTNRDFEWIRVDDGSTFDYTGIFDIRSEKNYGASIARNLGFQISSGDIITYLDIGDELSPKRVQHLIEIYNKYDINLLFDSYEITYPNGQTQPVNHFDYIGKHPKFPTAIEYFNHLNYQNLSIPLGVSHTRKPFVESGGFQRGIVCGEDGILWRRMKDKIAPNTAMFTDFIAGRYYISETGQSRTQRRPEMGGFAFDGNMNDNGKYLDEQWYKEFNSKGLYDGN